MKRTTRWLALLLATLLCITAFAACAPETPPDTPDTPPTEETPDDNPPSDPSGENDNKESEGSEKVDRYLYKRVVLIGVDGAGAFFRDTDTPRIDEIFEDGAISYNVLTANPTISAQCWGSMLHGVTPGAHRLTNSIVGERAYPADSPYPSVFRVIRENNPDATLASFTNWNPINVGIVEDGLSVHKDSATDAPMTDKICDYVKKNDPTLLFVQFDEVDHAGHTYGYETKQHLDQITATDELIGKIYDTYDEMGYLEDTLFIVTADHGGTGKSHGGLSDAEKYVMLAATGKTVGSGEIIDMEIRDCASVILYALGYEQPDSWTGRVPSGLFEGVEAGERPVSREGTGGHVNVDTPKRGSGNYITDVLEKDRILAYLPMDGDTEDQIGYSDIEENGKLYFVEGYFGEGVRLDDGYISLKDYEIGKSSFSASLWMNTGGVEGDPVLLSNKDWASGYNTGYVLSLRNGDVKFNAGDGKNRMDLESMLPENPFDRWVHVLLIVDREAALVKIVYDFSIVDSIPIPDTLIDDSFDSFPVLNIGEDGTGRLGLKLSAILDEFILIDGALTDAEIAALAEHYGMSH